MPWWDWIQIVVFFVAAGFWVVASSVFTKAKPVSAGNTFINGRDVEKFMNQTEQFIEQGKTASRWNARAAVLTGVGVAMEALSLLSPPPVS